MSDQVARRTLRDITPPRDRGTILCLLDGDWWADVWPDGCVDLCDIDDGYRVLDLDELIARLQEIKRLAVAQWGEGWGQ